MERHPIRCRLADGRRAVRVAVRKTCWRSCASGWSTAAFRCGAPPCSSTRCIPTSSAAPSSGRPIPGVKVSDGQVRHPGDRRVPAAARSWRSTPRASRSGAISPTAIARRLSGAARAARRGRDRLCRRCRWCSPTARSTSRPGRRGSRAASRPQQFADLESIIAPLTRVAEIRALRRTATNLLNTYVGRQAGERILTGKIRRGFVEEIRAAIWLSDMRGFTALSERLPPQELVDLLNRYFDCQVPPILEHGGEVLKFMGDGLLAIFPLAGNGDDAARSAAARSPARARRRRCIDALDTPPARQRGRDPLRACAARRPGDVRQHRRRQPARLHLHRAGGQSRGAAGEGRGATRPDRSWRRRNSPRTCRGEFTQLGECTVAGFSAPQAVFGLTAPPQ